MSKWICTDADTLQHGKYIAEGVWWYMEVRELPKNFAVVYAEIDLKDYSKENIFDIISGYYKDIEEIKNIYKTDYKQIICECIFEQTPISECIALSFPTEEKARKYVTEFCHTK